MTLENPHLCAAKPSHLPALCKINVGSNNSLNLTESGSKMQQQQQLTLLSSFLRAGIRSRRCLAHSLLPAHHQFHAFPSPQQSAAPCTSNADPTTPTSQTIFSGIQPTGTPHLGNYLGALRKWASLQRDSPPDTKLIFCLVDLHALTLPQSPAQLLQWKMESLATLLAVGLDPERCTIFEQSRVPAHAELMWLLSCGASMGMLNRMTQWKVCLAWSIV